MTSKTSTQENTAVEAVETPHECVFAARHGYCVECGADGWTPEDRRRIHAAQSAVRHG